jgi:hypothetical protein
MSLITTRKTASHGFNFHVLGFTFVIFFSLAKRPTLLGASYHVEKTLY